MADGPQQIMEQALEALVVRDAEIERSIVEMRRKIQAAELEKRQLGQAIKHQRAAVSRLNGRSAGTDTRPHARREPAEGTKARRVLMTIRDTNAISISIGSITTRTGLPSNVVRPILGELVTRGYIERVSDGFYKALESTNESQ